MQITLRARNGRYVTVIAEGAEPLRADRSGVGPWEVFDVIVHGDHFMHGCRVSLRAHTGRYVVAENGGGGLVHSNANRIGEWEMFTLERVEGSGLVVGTDEIRFATPRGYLNAIANGDLRVTGSASDASAIFTLETWSTQLVHLRCRDDRHYVCAEGGGGGEVVADRDRPLAWETFELVNRTNRTDRVGSFLDGDAVNLRAANGHFVTARDGALLAGQNRTGDAETFTLAKRGGSSGLEIRSGDQIALQAHDDRWVTAEGAGGGAVRADRPAPNPWETFTLLWADGLPIPFERAPSAAPVLATQAPLRGVRQLLTLIVAYSDMPADIDRTLTSSQLRDVLVGDGRSAKTWFEKASYRNLSLAHAGIFGPITVPLPFSAYDERDPSLPINAARDSIDSVEGETEFEIVRLLGDGPLRDGERVVLRAFQDRYVYVGERGYLFAAPEIGAEPFVIHRVAGPGPISSTDVVALEARDHQYVAALAGKNDLVMLNGRIRGAWEQFRLHRIEGGGVVRSSDKIALQSLSGAGQFLCADNNALVLDLLNAAERAGHPVHEWLGPELVRIAFDFSGRGGIGRGSIRGRSGTTAGGLRFGFGGVFLGLYLSDGPLQGADQLTPVFSTLLHELGHVLCSGPERYSNREPIRGDLVNRHFVEGDGERFRIERVAGPGAIGNTDWVKLRARNGNYVVVDRNGANVVNAPIDDPLAATLFQISSARAIADNTTVSFKAIHYLTAESDGRVTANRTTRGAWQELLLRRVAGFGPLVSMDEITLRGHHGRFVTAERDGRTTDRAALARGYVWRDIAGNGVGGGFDIMDGPRRDIMLCTYDRIRLGWIVPKVLTPENRGCYFLRSVLSSPEAIVLWDPSWPDEAYVLEQRRFEADFDQVPSEGIVVSWVNESADYWRRFLTGDTAPVGRYPAVISAAIPNVAPNQMIAAPTLLPEVTFGRWHPNAAFRSGRRVLPRGDGTDSRFELSFHQRPDDSITFCIL